jgi:uncharacterized protein YsxB (DUF464 family)
MIRIFINRNSQGQIYGFRALNHGNDIVCAGVSTLVFNTLNSIEAFTEETMSVDKPKEGSGYVELYLPDIEAGRDNRDVCLLLSSMLLGIENIRNQFPSQITVEDLS